MSLSDLLLYFYGHPHRYSESKRPLCFTNVSYLFLFRTLIFWRRSSGILET